MHHCTKNKCFIMDILPSLSSPKLPQPIFFPTRKFGPTINIPDEFTECLAGYNPLDDFAVAPAVVPPPLLVRITSVRPVVAAPLNLIERKRTNSLDKSIISINFANG